MKKGRGGRGWGRVRKIRLKCTTSSQRNKTVETSQGEGGISQKGKTQNGFDVKEKP